MQHDIDIAQENLATLMNYDSVFTIPLEPMEVLLVKADSLGNRIPVISTGRTPG